MRRPELHHQAVSQQAVLDMLAASPGATVSVHTLARRLYGDSSERARASARQIVRDLRRRAPGLEIERVTGYRLRAGGSL